MEKEECIFCKIESGKIKSKKLGETDNFFVIEDINPRSEGHALIITKKHYENVLELPALLGNELVSLIKDICIRLSKEKKSEGFNIIQNNFEAAGQIVPHFHVHIIPRKREDGLEITP